MLSTKGHKLVVTGEQPCLVEISSEEVKMRHDLETHHEEADNIIVQKVLKCGAKAVSVIRDDTDVLTERWQVTLNINKCKVISVHHRRYTDSGLIPNYVINNIKL